MCHTYTETQIHTCIYIKIKTFRKLSELTSIRVVLACSSVQALENMQCGGKIYREFSPLCMLNPLSG